MNERFRVERIGDLWAVLEYSDASGEWLPIGEWKTEAKAEKELEKWEAIQKEKEQREKTKSEG